MVVSGTVDSTTVVSLASLVPATSDETGAGSVVSGPPVVPGPSVVAGPVVSGPMVSGPVASGPDVWGPSELTGGGGSAVGRSDDVTRRTAYGGTVVAGSGSGAADVRVPIGAGAGGSVFALEGVECDASASPISRTADRRSARTRHRPRRSAWE